MKSMTNSPGLVKARKNRRAKALGPWVEWDRAAMNRAIEVTALGMAASEPPSYAAAQVDGIRAMLYASGWRSASAARRNGK